MTAATPSYLRIVCLLTSRKNPSSRSGATAGRVVQSSNGGSLKLFRNRISKKSSGTMPSVAAVNVWEEAARSADFTLALPGGVPMFFRRIPAGSFRMGARGIDAKEEPVHRVRITRDFYLGAFPVTQEQYRAVARRCPALKGNADPSAFKGARRPMEYVSWDYATAFCAWLSAWEELPAEIAKVCLPSETQWEYACRAGTDTDYYSGDGEPALAEVAWYSGNSDHETHPVDERPEAHPFGLYGMHGNVWEWCRDAWDARAYRMRADGVEDPEVLPKGKYQDRVLRGGSWRSPARVCRSAYRLGNRPDVHNWLYGFRVCLSAFGSAWFAARRLVPPDDASSGARRRRDETRKPPPAAEIHRGEEKAPCGAGLHLFSS